MRGSLIALLFSLILAGAACVGELETIDPDDTGGGTGGAGPDAGAGSGLTAKEYYDQNVAPMMTVSRPKGTCANCHVGTDPINGPDFFGTTMAEAYDTLVANTRLVNSATPAASVLITRGDHTGDAFCDGIASPYAGCTEDEITIITNWINLLAQ
jgi:hypothetical protein